MPILFDPIELHLEELENRLEECLSKVNRCISDKENESFNQTEKRLRWSLKYPAKAENHSDSFFDAMTQTDLYQVVRFAHSQTDFIASFTHLRGKYVKQKVAMKQSFPPV